MDERAKTEREKLLDKKIEELRKKNEARLKKFQEAEEDRKKAEEAGCAVILKKSSIYEDSTPTQNHRHRGQSSRYQNRSENQRTKKYVPGTSEEWKKYIEEKNKNNAQNEDIEENSNNNNNNNNNKIDATNGNGKKGRTLKNSARPIYTPKQMENRNSPDNVKPPPPDPKNSFLADSYRNLSMKTRLEEVGMEITLKEVGSQEKYPSQRKQQQSTPVNSTPQPFPLDARERINQLRACKIRQFGPELPQEEFQSIEQKQSQRPKLRPDSGKLQHRHNPSSNHKVGKEVSSEEVQKPLKSILKKPKAATDDLLDFNDSHPVIAVITTPGDDDTVAVVQGYNKKKEEAICDWLKNSDFKNDSDDEWEDIDEEAESTSSYLQEETKPADTNSETKVLPAPAGPVGIEDELELFEEDNAAFQQFIKQHTLTLDGEKSSFNWGTEMERLSLENRQKAARESGIKE